MNYGKYAARKKQHNIHSKSKKTTKFIGNSFIKVLVFAIVLIGVTGTAGVFGVVKAIIDSAPDISFLDVQPVGYSTSILDEKGTVVQELHGEEANRIYVEYSQIPQNVRDAFVAIEDERFWTHNGIDAKGIFRAIFKNLAQGDLMASGASTITQQLIKNNVLSTEKSWERKIQEQYLAVQLEKQMTKEQILEYYLNTAACGRGTNGIQAAAHTYFNKDVWDLDIAEAAVIAGITQRPTYYDPVINPDNNRKRQLTVLTKMYELGYITEIEKTAAENEDVYSHIQIVNEALATTSDYSYFVDEAIQRVATDLKIEKGYTENQAFNLIYRGGLSIYITQDLAMQAVLDDVFSKDDSFPPHKEDYAVKLMYSLSVKTADGIKNHYKEKQFPTEEEATAYIDTLKAEWVGSGETITAEKALYIPQPQAAMVIMDYYTGHVKALIGGRGQKIGNQTFNRATQAKRQPGSTFKVLSAYLPAIDVKGYTLATVLDDSPFIATAGGEKYSPKNWYDTPKNAFNYRGLSTVREGIQDSMNILAVRTIQDITPQLGFEYLINLGFTTLVDSETMNGKVYSDKTLSLPLGGLTNGVTPLELTAAYGAIANNGVYIEPLFYTKVLDHDGNILIDKKPITRTVMKETTSFLLTSALRSVVETGTGTSAKFKKVKMPVVGKTGTTSDNFDVLFVGYTPYYVAGIWMGYDQPAEMAYLQGYHKYVWRDVMERIHTDLPYKDFSKPDGIVTAQICNESGKLAVPGLCDSDPRGSTIRTEYFTKETVPTETCNVHTVVNICTSSSRVATEYCPASTVVPKIFITRPIPLQPETWDPAKFPRIADVQYELPMNMEGEYCHIHGPSIVVPPVVDPNAPATPTTVVPSEAPVIPEN